MISFAINPWFIGFLLAWGALALFHVTLFTRTRFHVRVLYDSGNTETFWARKFNFEIDRGGKKYEWEAVYQSRRPIYFNVDAVEAAWVIDQRTNLFHWTWLWFKAGVDLFRK